MFLIHLFFLFCFLFGWPDWTNWLQEVVYLQNWKQWHGSAPGLVFKEKKHWKQWVDQVTVEIEPMRLLMTKPFLRSALYYNWGWATELWQNICNECQKLLSDSHLSSPFGPLASYLGQPDPGPVHVRRARNLTRFPAYQRAMGHDCTVLIRPRWRPFHIYSIVVPGSICKETWVVPTLFPI